MNASQKTLVKSFIFGLWLKKNNQLVKAYMCLTAASIYGIRAAHLANSQADEALDNLNTERQRPVLELGEA